MTKKASETKALTPAVDAAEHTDANDTGLPPAATTSPARQSKAAMVLTLLQRPEGASLAELMEATGWLPHTTRAALTGLRKKGHAIERRRCGDQTCYFAKMTD